MAAFVYVIVSFRSKIIMKGNIHELSLDFLKKRDILEI